MLVRRLASSVRLSSFGAGAVRRRVASLLSRRPQLRAGVAVADNAARWRLAPTTRTLSTSSTSSSGDGPAVQGEVVADDDPDAPRDRATAGAATVEDAYAQVFQHWSRLNGDGLRAMAAGDHSRAEAFFIAAANVCATFTQTVATASMYGLRVGGNAPPPAVHRALSLCNLGICYAKQKPARVDAAKKVLRESIGILKSYTLSDYLVLGNVYKELAALYDAEGNAKEAVDAYHAAFDYFDRSHHRDSTPNAALALYSLALVHHRARNLADAETQYRAALDLSLLAFGPKHRNVGQVRYSFAHLLVDRQQLVAAKDEYLRAATVLQECNDPTFLRAMSDYMELVGRLGEDIGSLRGAGAPPKYDHPALTKQEQRKRKAEEKAAKDAAKDAAKVAAKTAAKEAAKAGGAAPTAAAAAATPSDGSSAMAMAAAAAAQKDAARIEKLSPKEREKELARLARQVKLASDEYETLQRTTKEEEARNEAARLEKLAARLEDRRRANEAQSVVIATTASASETVA